MARVSTVRIKSSDPERQGPFITINESKFDPAKHELFEAKGGTSKPEPSEVLSALRAEYEAAIGKRPFMGWDAATLRQKIAAAKPEPVIAAGGGSSSGGAQ